MIFFMLLEVWALIAEWQGRLKLSKVFATKVYVYLLVSMVAKKCNNNNNTYCVGHHASLEQPFTFSANMLAVSVDCILEKCFIVDGNKNFVCVARIPNTVESD